MCVCVGVSLPANMCVCVCVLESVRKLNFDFALMLRYGILGRSNQLVREEQREAVGRGGLRAFNLLCVCVFWVAHLGLPMCDRQRQGEGGGSSPTHCQPIAN